MEKLKSKHENLIQALETLERAIENYESSIKSGSDLPYMEQEEIVVALRDSLVQRFEFSFDLFWKYLKLYLQDYIQVVSEVNAPRSVIRVACNANLLTAKDTESLLEMLKSLNLTSHTYKEEIADQISKDIPEYYKIMKSYADKLVV